MKTDGNLKVQDQGCMLVGQQFDSSQLLNFCQGCACSMGSCIVLLQENSLFWLINAGFLHLKISWTRCSCWEWRSTSTARPFGTNTQWITPSKFHQTHNITLGPFFKWWLWWVDGDRANVSRRMGCGNRPTFHHMWQFLLIDLSSMGLPISWRQNNTLHWDCWCVSYRGTDQQFLYGFPKVLI